MSSSETLTLASHLSSSQHHIATSFCENLPTSQTLSSSFPSDSRRSTLSVAFLTRSTDGEKVFLFRSWSFYGDRCESLWLVCLRKIKNNLSCTVSKDGFVATLVHLETTTVAGWRLDCRLPDCGHCHHVPFFPQSVGYGYRVRIPLRILRIVSESEEGCVT